MRNELLPVAPKAVANLENLSDTEACLVLEYRNKRFDISVRLSVHLLHELRKKNLTSRKNTIL